MIPMLIVLKFYIYRIYIVESCMHWILLIWKLAYFANIFLKTEAYYETWIVNYGDEHFCPKVFRSHFNLFELFLWTEMGEVECTNYLYICWSYRMVVLMHCCKLLHLSPVKMRSMLELFAIIRDFYVSQFTVKTYCFADGRCLFKQPHSVMYHWNQYDKEISKKCRFVRLSVCLPVCPFVRL